MISLLPTSVCLHLTVQKHGRRLDSDNFGLALQTHHDILTACGYWNTEALDNLKADRLRTVCAITFSTSLAKTHQHRILC